MSHHCLLTLIIVVTRLPQLESRLFSQGLPCKTPSPTHLQTSDAPSTNPTKPKTHKLFLFPNAPFDKWKQDIDFDSFIGGARRALTMTRIVTLVKDHQISLWIWRLRYRSGHDRRPRSRKGGCWRGLKIKQRRIRGFPHPTLITGLDNSSFWTRGERHLWSIFWTIFWGKSFAMSSLNNHKSLFAPHWLYFNDNFCNTFLEH